MQNLIITVIWIKKIMINKKYEKYLKKIEEEKATGVRICKHLSVTAKALNIKLYDMFDF